MMFEQCPAYSKLFMELVGDTNKAAKFMNDIMPDSMKQANIDDSLKKAEDELLGKPQAANFAAETH